jgi:hypothetical protein
MSESFDFYAFSISADAQMSSPEKLCNFFYQLCDQGYVLVDNYYAQAFEEHDNFISDTAQIRARVLEDYRESSNRMIQEFFWKNPFEFSFSLDPNDSEVWEVSTPFKVLIGSDYDLGELNALELLKVIRKGLEIYPPYFGCGYSRDPDLSFIGTETNFKAIDVYDINFYSSAYIEQHLDKEHLLKAPAWCVEEIGNGILLVPSLQAIYTDDEESLVAIRQYLGYIM